MCLATIHHLLSVLPFLVQKCTKKVLGKSFKLRKKSLNIECPFSADPTTICNLKAFHRKKY